MNIKEKGLKERVLRYKIALKIVINSISIITKQERIYGKRPTSPATLYPFPESLFLSIYKELITHSNALSPEKT